MKKQKTDSMKIIATSDWHLGNLFHGNDRLPEHKHFLSWLLTQIESHQPDALLIAGDVFDNGNPSAAAQSAYYKFLADATQSCPTMQVVITAGNHDSANRLEAPRELLSNLNVEVRGSVKRNWSSDANTWVVDYDDLIVPITCADGSKLVVLAVPYLRSDIVQNTSYSAGVNDFLHKLTDRARELYPGHLLVMMAHMYAKGADIATSDASEKIVIGGQEEVNMEGWADHPDYLTCGHIHKRQHIWNTDWARYSGSVLPMSFAEKDYHHGVDLVSFVDGKREVSFLEYLPQHKLCVLPENDDELSISELKKLINYKLVDRVDGALNNEFVYLVLKVKLDKVKNDEIKSLENFVGTKNAVLCRIQKIIPSLEVKTVTGTTSITSVDDILNRDPMEALKDAFMVEHKREMSEHQESMLKELINGIINEK